MRKRTKIIPLGNITMVTGGFTINCGRCPKKETLQYIHSTVAIRNARLNGWNKTRTKAGWICYDCRLEVLQTVKLPRTYIKLGKNSFEVICYRCCKIESLNTIRKTKAKKIIIEKGWKNNKAYGWICLPCREIKTNTYGERLK